MKQAIVDEICPQCESGKLFLVRQDVPMHYKDYTLNFKEVLCASCDTCDYSTGVQFGYGQILNCIEDFRRNVDNNSLSEWDWDLDFCEITKRKEFPF